MVLRQLRLGFSSRARNLEVVLLGLTGAFVVVGWRSLDAAGFQMSETSSRAMTQFLMTMLLGHMALRFVAPRASAATYATVGMLSAIGLVFTVRLAPEVAQDQANWITLGVGGMVVTAGCHRLFPRLQRMKYSAAFFAAIVLAGTGLFGTTINGARLWITISGRTVQTTEIIKALLVVFLAGYLTDVGAVLASTGFRFGGRRYSNWPYLIPLVVTWLGAMAALALLKDLGTIALLLMLAIASLYVATGRLRFVAGGLALLGATAVAGYVAFGHVQDRIDTWRDPYATADSSGYQTVQGIYAIQAGGITGEGLGLGEPTVIPAVTTDYVFAAIAEELGLAGAAGVVLLFGVLVVGGLQVALATRDPFLRLLACCSALLLGIQAAVIIAGNLRLIPTTGITLPFVSYGGSSLVINFALIGLILGVSEESSSERS